MKVISIRVVAYLGIGAVCLLLSSAQGQGPVTQELNPGGTEFTGGSGNYNWNSGSGSNTPVAPPPSEPVYLIDQNTDTSDVKKISSSEFESKVAECKAKKIADLQKPVKSSKLLEIEGKIKDLNNQSYKEACTKYEKCEDKELLVNTRKMACDAKDAASDTTTAKKYKELEKKCKDAEDAVKEAEAAVSNKISEERKLLEADYKDELEKDKSSQDSKTAETNAEQTCRKDVLAGLEKNSAHSTDTCAESINIRLIKASGRKTEVEVRQYLVSDEGKKKKEELEKKYSCKLDDRKLSGMAITSQGVQMLTEGLAAYQGNQASVNTANTAAKGGDVYKTGYSEMGKAAITTGTTQGLTGLGQAAIAIKAASIAKKHKRYAEELREEIYNTAEICAEGGDANCDPTLSAAGLDAKGGSGSAQLELARTKHLDLAAKASEQATQIGMKGGLNVLGGVNALMYGKQLKDAADNMAPPPSVSPQLVPFAGGGGGDGAPPPTYQNPTTNDNQGESAVVAQDLAKDDAAGGPMNLAPPLLGPPNSGGIKGDVPAPNNAIASTGGPGGGSGPGSGLSGGGGGEAGEAAAEEDGSGQNLTGGVKGFEGTGGGGPAFTSTGGSDKRRVNDTGEMNLNALLEKFMPKKDEENKQGSILDFGGGKGGERGLASQQDDGSILGPNSNLFARVSNTMVANFKKGNLR